MSRWTHAVCDICWDAQEPGVLPLRLARPVIEYCGWCAQRTESGIYRREDPAVVPFPDRPADARAYVAQFRRFTMPGAEYVDTPSRRIDLSRMTDSDAVFVAGEFRRLLAEATARRAARPPPPRALRLT